MCQSQNTDIYKIIEPLVYMRPEKLNIAVGRKQILKHISFLKKKAIAEEVKNRKAWVVASLVLLINEKQDLSKWDKNKGSYGNYIRTMLYYSILEHYKDYRRESLLMESFIHKHKKNNQTNKRYIEKGELGFMNRDDLIEEKEDHNSIETEEQVYEKEFIDVVRDYYGHEIFDLRVAGYSNKEIAEEIGRDSKYLKKYLYRKKVGLIKHLEECGYSKEDLPESVINRLGDAL